MVKLREPVVYRSNRHNLTVEVKGAASQVQDPAASVHPQVKQARFRDGVYQTDDPEIVEALDARSDVWRADDPAADLKAELGVDGYNRLRKRMAQVEAAESSNKPSGETPEE